jgi:hypothetical protein
MTTLKPSTASALSSLPSKDKSAGTGKQQPTQNSDPVFVDVEPLDADQVSANDSKSASVSKDNNKANNVISSKNQKDDTIESDSKDENTSSSATNEADNSEIEKEETKPDNLNSAIYEEAVKPIDDKDVDNEEEIVEEDNDNTSSVENTEKQNEVDTSSSSATEEIDEQIEDDLDEESDVEYGGTYADSYAEGGGSDDTKGKPKGNGKGRGKGGGRIGGHPGGGKGKNKRKPNLNGGRNGDNMKKQKPGLSDDTVGSRGTNQNANNGIAAPISKPSGEKPTDAADAWAIYRKNHPTDSNQLAAPAGNVNPTPTSEVKDTDTDTDTDNSESQNPGYQSNQEEGLYSDDYFNQILNSNYVEQAKKLHAQAKDSWEELETGIDFGLVLIVIVFLVFCTCWSALKRYCCSGHRYVALPQEVHDGFDDDIEMGSTKIALDIPNSSKGRGGEEDEDEEAEDDRRVKHLSKKVEDDWDDEDGDLNSSSHKKKSVNIKNSDRNDSLASNQNINSKQPKLASQKSNVPVSTSPSRYGNKNNQKKPASINSDDPDEIFRVFINF